MSYDLRKPGRDYSSLHSHLKEYKGWAKPLESVWLIKSSLSCLQVGESIYSHLDGNDKLLVIDVTNKKGVWSDNMPQNVKEWLSSNLS